MQLIQNNMLPAAQMVYTVISLISFSLCLRRFFLTCLVGRNIDCWLALIMFKRRQRSHYKLNIKSEIIYDAHKDARRRQWRTGARLLRFAQGKMLRVAKRKPPKSACLETQEQQPAPEENDIGVIQRKARVIN